MFLRTSLCVCVFFFHFVLVCVWHIFMWMYMCMTMCMRKCLWMLKNSVSFVSVCTREFYVHVFVDVSVNACADAYVYDCVCFCGRLSLCS